MQILSGKLGGPEKGRFVILVRWYLSAESVEGTSLSLKGVDDVESGDSLSLGVFGVGHRVTDDILQKDLKDSSGLFVNESRDSLDSTTSS